MTTGKPLFDLPSKLYCIREKGKRFAHGGKGVVCAGMAKNRIMCEIIISNGVFSRKNPPPNRRTKYPGYEVGEPATELGKSVTPKDEFGYYLNRLHFIFDDEDQDDSAFTYPYPAAQSSIHLIQYGIFPIVGSAILDVGEERKCWNHIKVMGRIYEPINKHESLLKIGIGDFSELLEGPEYIREVFTSAFKMDVYDPRPEIDLSLFPPEVHESKMNEILAKTGLAMNDFHWKTEPMGTIHLEDYWTNIEHDW